MWKLAWRGFRHFWALHLVGGLSLAVAALVISGSLMVGHSVQQSLMHLALRRIGPINYAVVAARRLDEDAVGALTGIEGLDQACGLLVVPCVVSRLAEDGTETSRVANVSLVGVPPEFRVFATEDSARPETREIVTQLGELRSGEVAANVHLWRDLGEPSSGETLVIRTPVLSEIPREFVLGRKDRVLGPGTPATLARVIRTVEFPAEFSLQPGPRPPRNIFAPIQFVQSLTGADGKVNTLVMHARRRWNPDDLLGKWRDRLRPASLGLRIRPDDLGYVALETERLVLHPEVFEAAQRFAREHGVAAAPTAIQVAISIRKEGRAVPEIPYSIVAAFDVALPPPLGGVKLTDGRVAPRLGPDEILLNTWAAEDLGVRPGDRITLSYYEADLAGRLIEKGASFRLAGVVEIEGIAADRDLVPEYKGVTDARTISDWDAPFPIDLRRIRPKDEEYWAKYRTVPKAFVAPEAAQRLWQSRWGLWTSVRFAAPGQAPEHVRDLLERELLKYVELPRLGIAVLEVRERAMAAARGSTDFRGLFIGFSFFLLGAAVILAVALYRLFLVRRISQAGLLAAVGFDRARIFLLFVLESLWAVIPCSIVGGFAGAAFARLLIVGLATRWQGALRLNELYFYFSPSATFAGALTTAILALPVYYLSLRGFLRRSVRELLSGRGEDVGPARTSRRARYFAWCAGGLAVVVAAGAAWSGWAVTGFFIAGVLALAAALAGVRLLTVAPAGSARVRPGLAGVAWLGLRHVRRNPTRSMLVISLVSCATFMIVAVGANRHEPERLSRDRNTGHGGFALVGTTAVPLYLNPGKLEDRQKLAISRPDAPLWSEIRIFRLRYRAGDDTSCLNAYRPQQPAILGVPADLRQRGGFRFANTLRTAENPWNLLTEDFGERVVPAIGDNQTLTWILHHSVGDTMPVEASTGDEIQLKFVAALQRSIFQSELLIAEEAFVQYFPDADGYRFFLIECDPEKVEAVRQFLEEQLGPYGFDATPTVERLAEYLRVENTYLDTFQVLGGLGLILGTVGLGAVLWRSVLERAGELALLRAIGFNAASLALLLLLEDVALVALGVTTGTISAIVAILPHLVRAVEPFPVGQVLLLLAVVTIVGILSGAAALIPLQRLPLIQTLRREV